MSDAAQPRASLARTLGWAAYLGVSWTWCIGMFLPILLMRDFGWWAFPVFAIPNVVGAAAMGWVLKRKEEAAEICERHRPAVVAFSTVTIAFHCFWLGWMMSFLLWVGGEFFWITAGVALLVGVLLSMGRMFIASWLIWAASLAIGLLMICDGALETAHLALQTQAQTPTALFALAPVCVFGFLLCPYLDATFLRAREDLTPTGARAAFGVGFGVVFFAMILLTLVYSGIVDPNHGVSGAAVLLFPHFVVQFVFTVLVHLRTAISRHRVGWTAVIVTGAVCIGLFFLGLKGRMGSHNDLTLGEALYRCFMAFYGLVFPAYVWVCMIPTRDGHAGTNGERGRWKLKVLVAAVLLATPCYWMGFIERETWWLAPGLGVVLVARLLVMGRRRVRAGEAGEISARGGL